MNSNFTQGWPTYYQFQPMFLPQHISFPQQIYSFMPVQSLLPPTQFLEGSNLKQPRNEKTTQSYEDDQSESSDSSSSKSYQPRRNPSRVVKAPKKKLRMKPERNALTNIGNQILTFIYLRKKNQEFIKASFPDLSADELRVYYAFAKEIKQSMYGYINYDKLTLLWHPTDRKG